MKKEIKLPKELHSWLAALNRSLKGLNEEDRADILLSYVEQFNEELNQGKSVKEIKEGLRSLPEIASEIYAEFNLDSPIKLKDTKKEKVVKVKISATQPEQLNKRSKTVSFFSVLLSLGSWIMTLIVAVLAILFPIASVTGVVLSYINFDPYYASGFAVILLGLLPFVVTLLFFSTKGFYRLSVKLVKPFKVNPKKFGIKFWMILLTVSGVVSALILGGGIWGTYKDGYLDYTINQKYVHNQELLTFNSYEELADKILADNPKNEDNSPQVSTGRDQLIEKLQQYFEKIEDPKDSGFGIDSRFSWKQTVEGKPVKGEQPKAESDFNLKIERHFNLKENYQINNQEIKIKVFANPSLEIISLTIFIPELEWFNYLIAWQPETLAFIYS